jgi:quinol monooxygenase YgiN
MNFKSEHIETFKALFEERKNTIKSFKGCTYLDLLQDCDNPCIFFTYSHWESTKDLDHYRFSDFFKETWVLTKALFSEKAKAQSMMRI